MTKTEKYLHIVEPKSSSTNVALEKLRKYGPDGDDPNHPKYQETLEELRQINDLPIDVFRLAHNGEKLELITYCITTLYWNKTSQRVESITFDVFVLTCPDHKVNSGLGYESTVGVKSLPAGLKYSISEE